MAARGFGFAACLALLLLGRGQDAFSALYCNSSFSSNILSVRAELEGEPFSAPIMRLATDERIRVSFDDMTHRLGHYAYRIVACDRDWNRDAGVDEIDYLSGFNNNEISDGEQSLNTTHNYTSYAVTLPNADVQIKQSGNYKLQVLNRDDADAVVAEACFMVLDDRLTIDASIGSSTEFGVNNRYQQFDYTIELADAAGALDNQRLYTIVRQNGRLDSEVRGMPPTSIMGSRLNYKGERDLVFEGGNEYLRADFSHHKYFSGSISRIVFERPFYHVMLQPGEDLSGKDYKSDRDVDGRYTLHQQDSWSERETDYSIVHFSYPRQEPWLDGSLYVLGYLCQNMLDEHSKMTYNFDTKQYELTLVLKNGGYNYHYAFLPSGGRKATLARTAGCHWETENEYEVFVYYRQSPTSRDQLVGYSIFRSTNN